MFSLKDIALNRVQAMDNSNPEDIRNHTGLGCINVLSYCNVCLQLGTHLLATI